LPPVEQLLPPAVGAPARQAELPNIPGTIKGDRFEVVGSTVFSKQELDATLKEFVGRPLAFAQLLQARSAVSQLYISKGYITSGGLIGPQTLTASVVIILVLEGKLESINVAGTRRLNSNYVRSRLAGATPGRLNEQPMRSAMQLLQRQPRSRKYFSGTANGLSCRF
jgi:hemolysin activation/secretion protein